MNETIKFNQIMSQCQFSKSDIFFIVENYNQGLITKKQMSQFLMYVYENGLDEEQTFHLTCAMMSAGKILDLSQFPLSVDKHSTGGVSDSTTLIVVPLFALLGFQCFKMSGGALGHTGGTADKLSVFKNINIQLPTKQALEITQKHGGCFTCQTADIAPIDKKIYALRDEIGAVNSIPLIASSIMSKKLAVGSQNIILDVKYGSGALIQDKQKAQTLAELMCKIGKFYGKDVRYVLGDMTQPLGNAIGDYYEVMEVLSVLTNYKQCELINHSVHLVCQFADLLGLSYEECFAKCIDLIKNRSVYKKFCEIVNAQGGIMPQIKNPIHENGILIKSKVAGNIKEIITDEIGNIFHKYKNNINGCYIIKKIGDKIQKDEVLLKIFADKLNDKIKEKILNTFVIY